MSVTISAERPLLHVLASCGFGLLFGLTIYGSWLLVTDAPPPVAAPMILGGVAGGVTWLALVGRLK